MYILYIRTDDAAFGPYPSVAEAVLAARRYFAIGDSEAEHRAVFEHAEESADFVITELQAPGTE